MSKIYLVTKSDKPICAKSSKAEAEGLCSKLTSEGLKRMDILREYNTTLMNHLKVAVRPDEPNPPKPKASIYPDPIDLSTATKLWNKVAKRRKEKLDDYEKSLIKFKQNLANLITSGKFSYNEVEDFQKDHCNTWTFKVQEIELD